ncbi:LysM domain-containing protein [Plectosphaerella plurivora]|uniref:LysM domain-containing protein n=1 Tax=Plectosphaerella plurivora TaxID=936078 RepID=A0A9P8VDN2_9PEZI|nr:LysM domain-containing protein [Plectosphaerella plurivora]
MVGNCNKFHDIKATTTCQGIADYNKIALTDFYKWNPGINSGCTNLILGAYACTGVLAQTPTQPGVVTPTPIQPGMVGNCNKFHDIKSTTTCQGIADYNKIALSDFYKWNPGVNSGCTNLILGAYACTGVTAQTPTQPDVATPTPIQPGMVGNCNKFHDIKSTTTCQGIADYNKIALADFYKWNPGVNSGCTNLILGAYACTGVIGGSSQPPTTTVPSNGITTPSPIQDGMIKGCTQFHLVKTTTTCASIVDYYKVTLANVIKWNPAVGKDCSNLWANTYACVSGP